MRRALPEPVPSPSPAVRAPRPLPGWVAWLAVALGAAATTAYALDPHGDAGGTAFSLVAVAVPLGVAYGVRRNRPNLRWPWLLLIAAAVTSAAGATFRTSVAGEGLTVAAAAAHLVTLSSYALIGSGLLGMLRARRPGLRDRTQLLDGTLVAVSAWIAVWSLLVVPAVATGRAVDLQAVHGLYPTVSVVLAYLGIQLALTRAHRAPAWYLLAGCLVAVLVGDLAYAMVDAHYLRVDPAVLDAAYLAAFLCGMGAALHPTMRVLTEPQPVHTRPMGAARLAVVSTALLAPIVAAAIRPPASSVEWVVLLASAVAAMGIVVVRIARAVNEHAASEARLTRQATHDDLTGLANRTRALARLDDALGRGVDGPPLAVLFLDLDQFKDVNDTWGHTVGDRLLVAVAERLGHQLRTVDLLARFGGDEFVVVAPDLPSPQAALSLATRLAAELRAPVDLGLCQLEVAVSIGVVHVEVAAAGSSEDLLRDADTAMYRAKDLGGNAICLFDETMRADVARRVDLEGALRHAVDRDELRLHYQPVVDLASGALVGFEALVRWERPGHGLVPPLTFIPVAEDTGAIVAIGAWVLQEGCRQLAEWDAQLGLDHRLTLAVNLSARQLRDGVIVDVVAAALAGNGIAAPRLVVEITESVMLEQVADVEATLQSLRDLGVHLAADDFGTGYSSLSYLKRHPIDHVKIDRSFVTGLGTDRDDEGIVAAILAMARALDLVVVAEGIETPTQRRRLTELGCDQAQGYLFAAPLPPVAATALIERSFHSSWVPWDAPADDPTGLRALGRTPTPSPG